MVYAVLALHATVNPDTAAPTEAIIIPLFTQAQLLVLFWISCNLLRSERLMKGTLLALAFSSIILSALVMIGATAAPEEGRASAFGENPNTLATVLSFGLLALVGLGYGLRNNEKRFRIFACITAPLLLIAVVRTGSRGNLLALVLALFALIIKPHALRANLKAAFVVLMAVTVLSFAAYQFELVRGRWERTFQEGDTAGREEIFATAWEMFLQSPLIGWGPDNHLSELGSRLGGVRRDPHNLYLWILNETGLLGAILFFSGLWLCWRSAWKARRTTQGVVPLAMLVYLLLANLTGTGHLNKFFWLMLAYTVAAGVHGTVLHYSNRIPNTAPAAPRNNLQALHSSL
jgi:O-antigen ligase